MGRKGKGQRARTEKVTARITPEEDLVLDYLEATKKKSRSLLTSEALAEKYDFDRLYPIAQSFFAQSEQLINQHAQAEA
jgi:hypothetical protein